MDIILPLIALFIVLSFLGCALYGFVALVGKLFGLGQRSTANQPHSTSTIYVSAESVPENAAELHATCRQLVRMRRRGDLDQATYNQLRDKIDQVYYTLRVVPPPRLRPH